MAGPGTVVVLFHGGRGVIRGTDCESNFPANRNLNRDAYFDCASQSNAYSIIYLYELAYGNNDTRRHPDTLFDSYPDRDSESDAYRVANGSPNADSLRNAHVHLHCHDNSHQAAVAHREPERACHASCRDPAGTVSNCRVISNAHPDANVNARSHFNTISHSYVDPLFHCDAESEFHGYLQPYSYTATNDHFIAYLHAASNLDTVINCDKYSNSLAELYSYLDSHAAPYLNVTSHPHSAPDSFSDPDLDQYLHANSDPNAYSNPYLDAHPYGYLASFAHVYIDFNDYASAAINEHRHAHAATVIDPHIHSHPASNHDVYIYGDAHSLTHADAYVFGGQYLLHRQ